ncbi:MAG: hypothetical protein J3Q66DRAFT_109750 [Benniella sp.]|nr:MAG: hypothetical protein J3Q66DRAFT_109750 [Benniella sp.]
MLASFSKNTVRLCVLAAIAASSFVASASPLVTSGTACGAAAPGMGGQVVPCVPASSWGSGGANRLTVAPPIMAGSCGPSLSPCQEPTSSLFKRCGCGCDCCCCGFNDCCDNGCCNDCCNNCFCCCC